MNIVIFLGSAGSGKGTQSQYLKKEWGYRHISTGDLLREEMARGSSLGETIRLKVDQGDLVSDDIIIQMIDQTIQSLVATNAKGVIFDGFPRTMDQAVSLQSLLEPMGRSLTKVFYFDLSLEESLRRLSGRRIDPRDGQIYHEAFNPPPPEVRPHLTQRSDDFPEKISHRYDIFLKETMPLLDYYGKALVPLDCSSPIDQITSTILSELGVSSANA